MEQGSDEAFGLSVRLWPVGTCASVPDAEVAAGKCVDSAAVAGAVVRENLLDDDAVACEKVVARWRKPAAVTARSSRSTSA